MLNRGFRMSILKIEVEPREELGTRESNRLRKTGFIPVVLYSEGKLGLNLKLDGHKWERYITGKLNLVELTFPDGKSEFAAPREIQKDPLSQAILHVDFQGVKMDTAAEFNVAVIFTGIPEGTKEGGVKTVTSGYVAVECLPSKVPDSISIDISHLNIGQNVSAGELEMPEDVTLLSDPSMVLVSVAAVRQTAEDIEAEEALEAAAAAAAAAAEGEEGEAPAEGEKADEKPDSDSKE